MDGVGRVGQIKQRIGLTNPETESKVGDYIAAGGTTALLFGGLLWYFKGSRFGKIFTIGGLATTVVSLFFKKSGTSSSENAYPVNLPLPENTLTVPERDPRELAKEHLAILKDRTKTEDERKDVLIELARLYRKNDDIPVISILLGCLEGKGEVLRENPDALDVELVPDGDDVKLVPVVHNDEEISLGLRGGAALALAETGERIALPRIFKLFIETKREYSALIGPLSEEQTAYLNSLEKAFSRSLEVLSEGDNAEYLCKFFNKHLEDPANLCDVTAEVLLKNGIPSKYLNANNAANVSYYYASSRSEPELQKTAISSLTEAVNRMSADESQQALISLYGLYTDINNSFSSLDPPLEAHEATLIREIETKVQEGVDKILERNDPDEISQLNDSFNDLYPDSTSIDDTTAEGILKSGVYVFLGSDDVTDLALRFIDNSGDSELQNTSINILNNVAGTEVETCGYQAIPYLHNTLVKTSDKFCSMDIPMTDEQNDLLASLNSMLSDELAGVRDRDDYGERDFLEASFNEKCDNTAAVSDLSAGVLFAHGIVPEFVSPRRSLGLSLRFAKDDEKPVLQKGSTNALVELSRNYSGENGLRLVSGLYDTLVHVRTNIVEGRGNPEREEQARLLDESIQNVLVTTRKSGNSILIGELVRFFNSEIAGGNERFAPLAGRYLGIIESSPVTI